MPPFILSVLTSALAADLLVPGDFPSVQAAVDAASNGDHIIVTSSQSGSVVIDGVDVTLHGIGMNDVLLSGATNPVLEVIGGSDVTVQFLTLDGGGSRRALRMAGSATAVDLVGVKVSNGYQSDDGGGIRVVDGSLDLLDSILCDNLADAKDGGAVYLETAATFTATRTVFQDNDTNENQGGAVYSNNASATFSYTTLLLNRADKGSALLAKDGVIAVSNSVVANNEDDKNGNSQALRGEGGGSGFTGGANLFDNNNGGDIDGGYLPGDVFGASIDPDLVAANATCEPSTFADFTSTTGGDSDVNDVGAAGADSDGDGYGDRIDCAPGNASIHPDAAEIAGDGVDQNCDGLELCYVDADNDGFPTTSTRYSSSVTCANNGVTLAGVEDCNDSDPGAGGSEPEIIADGIDQDCDGGDLCYVDADNDGYRTGATIASADLDCNDSGEAVPSDPTGDCDDTRASVNPGETEIIGDGRDQDCDGDELCYRDNDNDGYHDGSTVVSADADCTDSGEGEQGDPGGDCADGNASVNPGESEVVGDGIDQDCDNVDDCYVDADQDDVGSTVTTGTGLNCDAVATLASVGGDCDDSNADKFPGNTEDIAFGGDQDCDGIELCYDDRDGDGFGRTSTVDSPNDACTDAGESTNNTDCDDQGPGAEDVYPGAPEITADEIDQDCDGAEVCWVDNDNDGFGTSSTTTGNGDTDCGDTGESTNDTDCDDNADTVFPGGSDLAGDALDQDCNGRLLCWDDSDMDGVAGTQFTEEAPGLTCDLPGLAFTADATDCADNNADRFPGNPEVPLNGIDEDCDDEELCYLDGDGDGDGTDAGTLVPSTSLTCGVAGVSDNDLDCNDSNDQINAAATESFNDGVDQNCDARELCPQDFDDDGFGSATQQVLSGVGDLTCDGAGVAANLNDCDDGDDGVRPTATEQPADGTDQNCDGLEECYVDEDGDGWGTDDVLLSSPIDCSAAGVSDQTGDCLDSTTVIGVDPATFYPGAPEIPSDGADQNCDGYDLELCFEDLDGDGFGTPNLVKDPTGTCLGAGFSALNTDCDDGASDVFPAAADDCDGIDNDCSEIGGPCEGDDDWDGDGVCASIRNAADDLDSEYDLSIDDCLFDSDGDGWGDGEELRDPFDLDPSSDDTDGDGVTDGEEWPRISGPSDPKPDLDADGLPDVVDTDDDGDGYDSVVEGLVDTDGDGTPDREDLDDDGDSIATVDEVNGDSDGDGTPDRIDTDDDGDGWSTYDEAVNIGSGYLSLDSDGDSRPDAIEGDWIGTVPVVGTQVDCDQLAVATDPTHVTIDGPEGWRKDFDGDGEHDVVDTDDDGDGKISLLEGDDDIDGDGCPNSLDVDSDGDGKLDVDESLFDDQDSDSIPDLFDSDDSDGGLADSDGDLVLTIDETLEKNGTLSLDPDTSCAESYVRYVDAYADEATILSVCDFDGTGDPSIVTSKGDLAIDGLELGGANGYDPVDRDGDGVEDWRDTDDDDDTVPTYLEVGFGCEPSLEASIVSLTVQGQTAAWLRCLDPKGVQEPTFQRIALTDPPTTDEVAYRDTDGDGILDFQDPDDDNDGWSTADEVLWGGLDGDNDGDGRLDHLDDADEDGPLGDLDADNIPNEAETLLGLDPFDDDTDGDGIRDDDEVGDDWENPLDTDGDGTIDALDIDDDDDGINTVDEYRGDTDGDGVPDYLDDDSDDDGVDDGNEYGFDDDCDGDPDHVDPSLEPNLCNEAFDAARYERQACSCASTSGLGAMSWLGIGLAWFVRRRR